MARLSAWVRVALPALLLLVALGAGGYRDSELPLVLVLAVAAALARPDTPAWTPSPRVVVALTVALTLQFVVRVVLLPNADQPLGTDWFAYLKNAVALAEGDWDAWHRWRGPLHAALCVVLTPVAGGLLEASQLLSLLSIAACIPMTAWLAGRLTSPSVGLTAAALLALWPDLLLFARYSTPYALLTAVLLAAAAAAVKTTEDARWGWVTGVFLAATTLTDARGPVLAGMVLVGLLLRRTPLRSGAVAGLTWVAISGAVFTVFPVDLVPLADQIGLQRDLNASAQLEVCAVEGGTFPSPAELAGPCARATFADNLARAQRVIPVSLAVVAGLALLGIGRRSWFLLLPLVPAIPSLLLVRVMHRYGVPLAPFAVGLAAAALDRVVAPVPRGRWLLIGALVAAAMVPWTTYSGTLLARAWGERPQGGAAYGVVLTEDRGLVHVRRLLREAGGDTPVVDCARAGLRMRLYPREVEELGSGRADRQPARCRRLLTKGSPTPTWLLTVITPDAVPAPSWTVVYRWTRADGEVLLLRSE